ncbi:hypothetical protein psyc5s11_36450 [Clostridium gelidum]|uniref:Uncharacterized protein n=2 Tax=Clostridium gelidum TaxID=704125 RepID=A0ABM7T6C0_9CLOT|nr:hypothetical protein psyc5s11_36450 [Clostridium gelidum]
MEMSMYLLAEIIKGDNRGKILEAIDYANEQWKAILENENYSEIKHLERKLEHMTSISTGKSLLFYTGITQFNDDGFSECNKAELRAVLDNMHGICLEIDSMISSFKKDYNI